MRYAFIAEHRPIFSIRAMCRCLSVQPSGFYAWLKAPLSRRAQEDHRQTELIRTAWNDSAKVYGYRKIHDGLMDMGETCCPNRVARLAQLAGIRAQRDLKPTTLMALIDGKPMILAKKDWRSQRYAQGLGAPSEREAISARPSFCEPGPQAGE